MVFTSVDATHLELRIVDGLRRRRPGSLAGAAAIVPAAGQLPTGAGCTAPRPEPHPPGHARRPARDRRPAERLRRRRRRRPRHAPPRTSRATGPWRASTSARDAWVADGPGGGWSATPTPATSTAPASSRPTCGCTRTHDEPRAGGPPAGARRAPRRASWPPRAATDAAVPRHLLHQPRTAPSATCCSRHGYALRRTVYRMAADLDRRRPRCSRRRRASRSGPSGRGQTSASCTRP